MKVQNKNSSSFKTKRIIRKMFAEMLSEKKDLGNISISELCQRAEISRGTFYAHYDDIYGVAEEYENELIDAFFNNFKSVNSHNIMEVIDAIFLFIRQNDENYRLLCKSNEILFAAKKLTQITSKKLFEIVEKDFNIKNNKFLELDITIFLDGLFCEYVKGCRGYSDKTLDDLYEYSKFWVASFIKTKE